MPPPENGPREQLTSWKEISAALGVAVRTAQRWERDRGLPVRRLSGDKGRIVADASELADWKQALATDANRWADGPFLRLYTAGSTAALLVLACLLLWIAYSNRRGLPASVRPEFKSVVVSDAHGRELWRWSFPDVMGAEGYYSELAGRTSLIGDLDGDSEVEVLFAYLPAGAERTGTELACFSASGKLKWRFEPGGEVADGTAAYSRTYVITDMAVWEAEPDGGFRIAVSSNHAVHHPSQVALLDGRGNLLGEYWHSGHLDALETSDLDRDGFREILAVGTSNGNRAATLVVLDSRNITGASCEQPGSPLQLRNLTPASEKAVLQFPRTCVNRRLGLYNQAKRVRVAGESISVRVQELGGDYTCAAFYTLDRSLQVTRVEVSDTLRAAHQRLESEGALDHRLTGAEVVRLGASTRSAGCKAR